MTNIKILFYNDTKKDLVIHNASSETIKEGFKGVIPKMKVVELVLEEGMFMKIWEGEILITKVEGDIVKKI